MANKQAHIVMVPLPAQGHAKPLLKLAYKVASHGIKVTFVDTGSLHKKPVVTKPHKLHQQHTNVGFVSVSVGLEVFGDQSKEETKMAKRAQAENVMDAIKNMKDYSEISCVVADATMGWILSEVAEMLSIQTVSFFPLSIGSSALVCHIEKLTEAGTIDTNGNMVKSDEVISLSADIPPWKATEISWIDPRNAETQKSYFEMSKVFQKAAESVDLIVCNSSLEFEPAACDLIPGCLTVGPLIERDDVLRASGAAGSFWLEDTSCLDWLDTKPPGSVIYVAFGSAANLYQHEFDELALGLESSGRPFLWVVRSDITSGAPPEYPVGFLERVADLGKIVEWAPQENVLAHPSVACFLTHCGWNSSMESISRGVPLLCWPSFSDQFHNASYISDIWKVGLKLNKDESGIISRHEINIRIELLLSDDSLKINAANLKKKAQESVLPGGSSFKNFEKFINFLRY
ncbi:glycosyltransferase [Lithospermum erythrorhizon]|uniref:Glycosyltransferase n=1 Tax=Lithospermum erythrorhizon TaxID=34254 RepID=A0AAV3P6Q4_LITER